MQFFLPFPQSAMGVFQNLIVLKYDSGAFAWYFAQDPLLSVFVWYGHDAPMTASPFLNSEISSDASAQYFFTSGRCFLSNATAALNCAELSSYGSLIPRLGLVFIRYSAASAIWIGLSGTVT